MQGKDKEALIQNTLTEQYDRYYLLAYSLVKDEAAAMHIVNETAYKAIYYSDRLGRTQPADVWIEGILRKEAERFLIFV